MDEITKKALEEFVQKMLSAVEQGATFTAEQAPLVVQEWLRWQMVEALVIATILLILSVGSSLFSRWCWSNKRKDPTSDWEFGGVFLIGTAIGFALFSLVVYMGALKIYLAPRVVVLEKFVALLK